MRTSLLLLIPAGLVATAWAAFSFFNPPSLTRPVQIDTNTAAPENLSLTSSVDVKKTDSVVLGSRKYLGLSDAEKRQYIESRAQKVAAMIGNRLLR